MVIKKKSVFIKILIPLLLLGLFQSLLVGGAVLMGGTIDLLRDNSRRILGQNLQNRQIELENGMAQRWSNLDDCVEMVQVETRKALEETGMTLWDLQRTGRSSDLLRKISGHLLDTMRKNSVTGVFVVLSNGEDHVYPTTEQNFQGVYFRNLDPKTNPGDYSDILLERGPASVGEAYHITLDSLWREEYRFTPPAQGRLAMNYYFAPYLAARENPGLHYKDLGRWSEPFRLSGDSSLDATQVIAYSVPLLGQGGMPYGVLGIEVSLDVLYGMLPARDVDTSSRGGYMLVTYEHGQQGEELVCVPQVISGNALKQVARDRGELRLMPQPEGLYLLRDVELFGEPVYAGLLDLELYNSNTPFSGQQWALAAMINEEALYGIAGNLRHTVVIAMFACLLISAVCVYLVASHTTRPLSRAAQRLQDTDPEKLAEKTTGVREIDNLFTVIRDLNRRQKAIEIDLNNERERYLLALESTTNIILEYDCAGDTLLIYHLEKENGKSRVSAHKYRNFRSLAENGAIHPEDRSQALGFLDGKLEEITVRCQSAAGSSEYRWFFAKGKAVYSDDGQYVRTIGSTRDVTGEKEAELAASEANKRDPLTGLLKREEGERILRLTLARNPNGCLALLDLDDFGRMNEQYGMLYCDLLLEAISSTLRRCAGPEDILARYGGDEFLIYFAHQGQEQTLTLCRQICRRVMRLNEGQDMGVSCSIGFSCARGGSYESLLERAVKALEFEKRHDRAGVGSYEMIQAAAAPGWQESLPPWSHTEELSGMYYEAMDNIVSLAFNLFEKTSDVKVAIPMLLSKLARHFSLRRVLVLAADLDFYTSRVDYQWSEFGEENYAAQPEHFRAGAFRTLIQLYGTEGTLYAENLEDECRRMMKWRAGIVSLCCPMYDNGRYTGSVVLESGENIWTQESVELVKEIVKLLSAHISKSRADLASRAKSEFLSRMSHEIRTPMNAIMGMTNIAMCLPRLPERAGECLKKIDASARYLLSLINDILDMSKIESGKMVLAHQSFDLEKLLGDLDILMRPQAESKGLRLVFDGTVEDTHLIGDALRLNQILVNLLSNAVKFTDKDGVITVTVDEVLREGDKAGLRFSVRDTGIGIDSRQVMRIFNAFEQEESDTAARYGGTGLGLSISGNLVRMMEGKLEVETAVGKGSEFYFTIFLEVDKAPAEEAETAQAIDLRRDLTGKRVLLVEDNDLNIEIAREILQMNGMEVTEARNGEQAVKIFSDAPAGSFDAVLMDIRMPVMDGLEATRIIRGLERPDAAAVPIIAMTANAFDDDMKKSIESGMNGHLAKPFEIEKLLALLARLIPPDKA